MQCLWRRLKRKTYGLNFDKESLEKKFQNLLVTWYKANIFFTITAFMFGLKLQDLYEEELKQKENKELIFEFLKEKVVKCISKYQKLSVIL